MRALSQAIMERTAPFRRALNLSHVRSANLSALVDAAHGHHCTAPADRLLLDAPPGIDVLAHGRTDWGAGFVVVYICQCPTVTVGPFCLLPYMLP